MEYTLIRKRNKRAYLRVRDGAVVVTAPFYMTKKDIDFFVESHRDWIEKELQKQNASFFEDGMSFQVLNKTYTLKVLPNLKKSGIYENTLYVKNLDKDLKNILKIWFSNIAKQRFDAISSRLGIYGYKLSFGFYTSKWGSCTPAKKKITINIYLLFTDIEIIDAIIYHELAHTIHFNHSKEFYAQVLKWYPEYHIHHKRLKKMNIPRIKKNVI